MNRPKIVTLCGSTRFFEDFQKANYELTMQGIIVLSVGFYPHATAEAGHGEGVGHDSADKAKLDQLHFRKIELSDEIYVLNKIVPICDGCGKPCTLFTDGRLASDHVRWGDTVSECCKMLFVERPYIGESTRNEIRHAIENFKPVRFLNPNPSPL